jgi:hypothetical protein
MDLKDIKKISILIPTDLNEITKDLEILIHKNENIIKKYLEKNIYTSVITDIEKEKLDIIFTKIKTQILL